MMTLRNVRSLRSLRRAAFFSLVTSPALLLFICFALLSFNNSVTGTFLTEARLLVGDAPPDKVNLCVHGQKDAVDPIKPQPAVREPCTPVQTDSLQWQQEVDQVIRDAYLLSVLLGLGVWFAVNGIGDFPRLKRIIRNMKS